MVAENPAQLMIIYEKSSVLGRDAARIRNLQDDRRYQSTGRDNVSQQTKSQP